MRVAVPLLSLALLTSACASAGGPSGPGGPPPPPPPPGSGGVLTDWRGPITANDRDRLNRLDRAWSQALGEARRTEGSGDLASVGNLIDPDAARPGAEPPVGDYRCRTVKLGNQGRGGLGYVVYGWFDCRVERTANGLRFSKLTGSQRQTGLLFPEAADRMIFLGGLALSDEPAANSYGQNPERDIVGAWERFGDRRWRLVMPYPVFESTLDLLEVVPR